MQLKLPSRPHAAVLSLLVAGVLVTGMATLAAPTTAQAAGGLHYRRGYSVQNGWLCYGWASGTLHCTHNWYRSGSRLISRNTNWVPNGGGTTYSAPARTRSTHSSPTTFVTYSAVSYAAPAGISQWAWTGHGAYSEPYGTYQGYSWGWCTSGAAMMAHDNVSGLGYAASWARNAAARGMAVGSSPAAGATVVFQPGVQGASGLGHVAHVVSVYGNGWFLVAETSFTFNGGGFGRVSYRYAHTGYGVSFIY